MSREMKHSGIDWIGDIPKEWSTSLLSSLFLEHKRKNTGVKENNLLSLSYGAIIRKDINTNEGLLPQSFESYNIIADGDIVFRLTDLQNDKKSLRTGLCKEKGIITSAYITIRRKVDMVSPSFFHYLFHSYDICKVFYGLGDGVRQGMNYGDLRKMPVVYPPLSEQQKIADYLDKVCGEIDGLVALQEAMIDELKAYKQSVITEAVTRGLNPNVPLKPSGIDWIELIPKDWDVIKGKNLLIQMSRPVRETDEVVTCFRDGEVVLRSERRTEGFTMSDKEIGYQGINKGDIVIHGMDGFAGAMGVSKSTGKGSPVLIVCNPKESDNSRYIIYYLRSLAMTNVFLALATGIRERSCDLRWKKIAELPFIRPSFSEQQQIANYLDTKCAEIDALVAIKQQKIEELKDYKKSIIYEYVTGKKEVV